MRKVRRFLMWLRGRPYAFWPLLIVGIVLMGRAANGGPRWLLYPGAAVFAMAIAGTSGPFHTALAHRSHELRREEEAVPESFSSAGSGQPSSRMVLLAAAALLTLFAVFVIANRDWTTLVVLAALSLLSLTTDKLRRRRR